MVRLIRNVCVLALLVCAMLAAPSRPAEANPTCEPTPCEAIASYCGALGLPYNDSNEEYCEWTACNGRVYAYGYRNYQCGQYYSGTCLSSYIYDPNECSEA